MKSLICSALLLMSFSAFAAELNELCLKANISSLRHLDLDHWDGENICEKSLSDLTTGERRNIEEIYDVHKRAADLFDITVSELFNSAIEVDILETTLGGLASSAGGSSINMGVYPKSDYTFNKGIYAHELGHVLSGNGNTKLPSSFKDLDNSVLFTEMFADLLALALFDQIIIPVKGEETCIDRARYIARGQTYNMPMEYFLSDFSMARVAQCCKSKTMIDAHDYVKGLCEEVSRMGDFVVKLSDPFDPITVDPEQVDDHQIGIPLLSFMKELSVKTGLEMKSVFKLGFDHILPRHEEFTCVVSLNNEVVETLEADLNTVRGFLLDLRQSLSFADQMIYDLLASKYAIEKGLQFGDRSIISSVLSKVKTDLIILSNTTENHICKDKIKLVGSKSEECQVTCQKKQ